MEVQTEMQVQVQVQVQRGVERCVYLVLLLLLLLLLPGTTYVLCMYVCRGVQRGEGGERASTTLPYVWGADGYTAAATVDVPHRARAGCTCWAAREATTGVPSARRG